MRTLLAQRESEVLWMSENKTIEIREGETLDLSRAEWRLAQALNHISVLEAEVCDRANGDRDHHHYIIGALGLYKDATGAQVRSAVLKARDAARRLESIRAAIFGEGEL